MEVGNIVLIVIIVCIVGITALALVDKDVNIKELTRKNKLLESQLIQETKVKHHLAQWIDKKDTELHQLRLNAKEYNELVEAQLKVDLTYDTLMRELNNTIANLEFDRDTWKARAQHEKLPKKTSYQLDENFQIG